MTEGVRTCNSAAFMRHQNLQDGTSVMIYTYNI
jgi:hypothetical protein